jgi:hypothetical protein
MSNNAEFDRYSERATGLSRPMDPEADTGEWLAQQRRLHQLIFRAGAYAGVSREFRGAGDDSLARLAWLADHGFFTNDVRAVVSEVQRQRERDDALTDTYGLTDSDIESMVGEGFHTAFRKAVDSPEAVVIHKLIKDMDSEIWGAIVKFVADPIISYLREARQRQEEGES